MNNTIEICCGSYQDAINAYNGGAKRIELNSALYLGGLTPSVATLKKIKEDTDLTIICMVRNRAAGFNYNENEIKIMLEDAKILLDNGTDGIAFGFLNQDKTINEKATVQMNKLIHSYQKTSVFHRAIDVVNDYEGSIKKLIQLKCDRLLTSGQEITAIKSHELIKKINSLYGQEIEILAGSGIDSTNAKDLINKTGINQIHSSCRDYLQDITTTNNHVTYNYLEDNKYEIVSTNKVKKLIESVK